MKRTLLAGAVAATLGLGIIAPAQAAPTPDEQLSAGWLAEQVPSDGIVKITFGEDDFDDFGLTADVVIALSELDLKPESVGRAADALSAQALEYVSPDFEGERDDAVYAGSAGKLTSALQIAGRDVRAVEGVDLVELVESTVTIDGPATGRASDITLQRDFSNAIGQSWVVRALSVAGSGLADEVTGYLVRQQCADGSVIESIEDAGCTSGSGQIDATAFALQAFVVARENGVADLDDEIGQAVGYLRSQQAGDGSFSGPTPNTNTTGLAANALQKAGAADAAARAADWIFDRQVTTDNAEGSQLASELGAIAFDEDAFAAGRTDGITATTRDQWRRATAQAALALPAADLSVRAPRLAATGATETVEVSRLEANQDFEVTVETVTVAGRSDAAGRGSVDVVLPEAAGDVLVEVTSVPADETEMLRTGSTTVTVLGAAEFDVTVTPDVARPGSAVEVGFGESTPADGEDLDLFVVPVEAVEDALADADEDPTGPRALSADQVDALDREGLEDAAVETLDVQESETFEVEAPTEAGEYVVFVLSRVSDERGGAAALDVVAADPAVTPGGLGGSGDGVGADASVLPNGGSPVTPWSLWLAVAATVFGAALVRFGLKRRATA